jgi:hypothetical protein
VVGWGIIRVLRVEGIVLLGGEGMPGHKKPSMAQRENRGAQIRALPWRERMKIDLEENPGVAVHKLASKYGVTIGEVEDALEIDPDMDVVLGKFGKVAWPVLASPHRYSEAIRRRAKVALSNTMSVLMDKERVKASSTTALATLAPMLVRMIVGDLQIDPMAEPGGAKAYTKEELVLTLKRSITQVREKNPMLAKELTEGLAMAEKMDGKVVAEMYGEKGADDEGEEGADEGSGGGGGEEGK